jgi:hypothetical protein
MSEKKKDKKTTKPPITSELPALIVSRRRTVDEKDRTTLEKVDPRQQMPDAEVPDKLGELLVNQGLITRHQLFNALNESYRVGCTLKEALLSLGYIDQKKLQKLNLPED